MDESDDSSTKQTKQEITKEPIKHAVRQTIPVSSIDATIEYTGSKRYTTERCKYSHK